MAVVYELGITTEANLSFVHDIIPNSGQLPKWALVTILICVSIIESELSLPYSILNNMKGILRKLATTVIGLLSLDSYVFYGCFPFDVGGGGA